MKSVDISFTDFVDYSIRKYNSNSRGTQDQLKIFFLEKKKKIPCPPDASASKIRCPRSGFLLDLKSSSRTALPISGLAYPLLHPPAALVDCLFVNALTVAVLIRLTSLHNTLFSQSVCIHTR